MNKQETIQRRIREGMLITAYRLLIEEIGINGLTENLLAISKELSKEIRGKSYQYASKKNERDANEMDSLLKLVVKINGEGIYE